MPVNRKGGPWSGGYISLGKGGRETYFIEREVGGIRFHVSTRCHSRRAAEKQLDRFEANPTAYRPEGGVEVPLLVDDDLIDSFHAWGKAPKPAGRGNSSKHTNEMRHRLREWRDDLAGRDLRGFTVRDLKDLLDRRGTCRQHRVIAIKSFCSWLRRERGILKSSEDPTLDLAVPATTPEKLRRRKVVEFERVQAAYAKLEPVYRDVVQVLAGTGMHLTELARFIRQPDSQLYRTPEGATLSTRHKSGERTAIPLTHPEHIEAAERLRARHRMPGKLNKRLADACAAAEVEPFKAGVFRHSVATFAKQAKAPLRDIAEFLGHTPGSKMTAQRYVDAPEVPTVAVPVPVLRLVR